jgi:hypothetical protein
VRIQEKELDMNGLRTFLVLIAITFIGLGVSGVIAQDQAQMGRQQQHSLHDANSDGICDVCGQPVGSGQVNAQGKQAKKGKHWGPGDGSGNQGNGPKDGTGYGSQSGKGIGARDGTGPYHQNGVRGGGQRQGSGRRGGRS